ncbi:hypothetical protein ABW19_dt0201249 [Dactylella cylindrospora]|nr:hypothetical protein ABW19_dt0201249 [Dactylella cylindrospora]
MIPNLENLPDRIQTTLRRLPILTRVTLGLSVVLYILGRTFGLDETLRLDAAEFGFSQLHRLNTYPFVHSGLIHLLINLIAVTYPLSRFEKEKGTLHTLLMVLGPFSTFPALAYIFLTKFFFGGVGVYSGLSIWIVMFAAMDATRLHKVKPFYWIAGYRIPSWAPVLGVWLVLEIFVFGGAGWLIHVGAMAVGWAYAAEYLKLLEPPEKILKFIETRLKFLISRVPFYVSLEARDSAGYNLILPTFRDEGNGGVDMSTLRMNPRGTPNNDRGNFGGTGRPLGS